MSTAAVVARISRSSTSLPFLGSLALPVPDCSFYTVTTYVRCYAPWYKSVIQLGVGLYGIHYLGPAALGSVYPVETSTSLYNLYIYRESSSQLAPIICKPVTSLAGKWQQQRACTLRTVTWLSVLVIVWVQL